jgi:hypothetical protein
LQGLELGDFAGVATRVCKYLSSFTAQTTNTSEPSYAALDQLRRESVWLRQLYAKVVVPIPENRATQEQP